MVKIQLADGRLAVLELDTELSLIAMQLCSFCSYALYQVTWAVCLGNFVLGIYIPAMHAGVRFACMGGLIFW